MTRQLRLPWTRPSTVQALDAEPAASGDDARLLQRVRWRLIAWSGGSTLVVLLVLGTAIYLTVAGSLAATATAQLEQRARDLAPIVEGPIPFGPPEGGPQIVARSDAPAPGIVFLADEGASLALIVGPRGEVVGDPGNTLAPLGLPDRAGVDAARAGRIDVRSTSVAGSPARILSRAVERDGMTYVIQVVQERATEERTLGVLLMVLGLGGLLVLLASLGVGAFYAERALVPIRDSLRRQREFAADASHELRTPLAVIRGSLEHLRRNRERRVADVGTALEDLDAEAQRLTDLVDELLLLARTDSGAVQLDLQPIDLAEVAMDALPGLAALASERGIRVEVDAAPAPLSGDPARLRQLIRILVDNAVRHSPDARGVAVTVRPEPNGVALAVEDEGRGIREEDLPHVFDRFWRAPDAPPGGTGLGLAIARWIVERHGGTIVAGNRAQGGARFEVRLPRG